MRGFPLNLYTLIVVSMAFGALIVVDGLSPFMLDGVARMMLNFLSWRETLADKRNVTNSSFNDYCAHILQISPEVGTILGAEFSFVVSGLFKCFVTEIEDFLAIPNGDAHPASPVCSVLPNVF